MAPAEYVLQQRIAAAQQLLADSGKSITEIAYELGFSSSQTFATAFRRITSLRPSDVVQKKRTDVRDGIRGDGASPPMTLPPDDAAHAARRRAPR